jgi:hypothetical protein
MLARMTGRQRSISLAVSAIALGAWFCACKAGPDAAARQWFRCSCSYISDFDEPGAAPIDVCAESRSTSDIAAACTRNAGVGVPTSCRCEAEPRGPCDPNDRCRAVDEPRR